MTVRCVLKCVWPFFFRWAACRRAQSLDFQSSSLGLWEHTHLLKCVCVCLCVCVFFYISIYFFCAQWGCVQHEHTGLNILMTAGVRCVLVNVLLHEINVKMSKCNKHTRIIKVDSQLSQTDGSFTLNLTCCLTSLLSASLGPKYISKLCFSN